MNNEFQNLFQQTINLLQQGEISRAETLCKKLINIYPNYPDLYNIRAIINDKKGLIEDAITCMEKAISLQNDNHLYYINLGEFYKKSGNFEKAIQSLIMSIQIKPDFHGSRYNLANIYKSLGNFQEAEKLYKEAIQLEPNDYQSLQNLGNIYNELGYYEQAAENYFAAYRIDPTNSHITAILASCFSEIKNEYQAEYFYKTTLALKPDDISATKSLSVLYENQSKFEEGMDYYKKYTELLKKEGKYSLLQKLHLEMAVPTFDFTNYEINKRREKLAETIEEFQQSDLKSYDEYTDHDFLEENLQIPSQLTYQGYDNKDIKIEFANIFKNSFPVDGNTKFNEGKIKIGFLVTRSNEGIFTKFMSGIINNLDRNEFDVFIICDEHGWKNKVSQKIINSNIVFIPFKLKESSEIIKGLNLDILYYWEIGNDSLDYFLPFFRLAPVQCTSIGWPETTGIPNVDYFISSELIENENSEEHYSEKLFKLKGLPFNIEKPALNVEIKPLDKFGIDSIKNIYLCPQNLRKIQPDFDRLVSGILNKDENGVVVFIGKKHHDILNQLKMRIRISYPEIYNRVIFLEHLNYQDYLSLVSHSHVVLDTLYFGGANTSYDIFAMERPIVTFPYTHERGRYTLGCYSLMGITDLIANSFDEYVDLAVKTATDADFRNNIIHKIKEKNHLLFGNSELIKEYSDFFKHISR